MSSPMPPLPSRPRIRVALARFCLSQGIDLEEAYGALGVSVTQADPEALAHLAGVYEGMQLAAGQIRKNGLNDWATEP